MATVPGVFLGHKSSKEVWHNVVMVNHSPSHFGWQNLKDKHYFRSREDVPNYLRAWAGFPAAWVVPGLRCVHTARGHVCRGSVASWGSRRLGMGQLAAPLCYLLFREIGQLNQRRRQPPQALWNLEGVRLGREEKLVPATLPGKWWGPEPIIFVNLPFLPFCIFRAQKAPFLCSFCLTLTAWGPPPSLLLCFCLSVCLCPFMEIGCPLIVG